MAPIKNSVNCFGPIPQQSIDWLCYCRKYLINTFSLPRPTLIPSLSINKSLMISKHFSIWSIIKTNNYLPFLFYLIGRSEVITHKVKYTNIGEQEKKRREIDGLINEQLIQLPHYRNHQANEWVKDEWWTPYKLKKKKKHIGKILA